MRITWFGNRCVRINFSSHSFVFYAHEAVSDVANAELIGDAVLIDDDQTGPFVPLNNVARPSTGGRLIDAMDQPEHYLKSNECYILDAPPDERLMITFLGDANREEFDMWKAGAVVLFIGSSQQCMSALDGINEMGVRQLIFAVSDLVNLNMNDLAQKAGKMRLQLLEAGFALEL